MADTTPICYDVLILGAGPAGIAAARHLQNTNDDKDDTISFRVLEARSRVGGRTYTSDSLGANYPLDKGARWIHGTCRDNRIVQLVKDRAFDLPSDVHGDVAYDVYLPWDDKASKMLEPKSTSYAIESDKTPPPFELSDSALEAEPMIVRLRNDTSKRVSTKNMTKIISKRSSSDETLVANPISMDAQKVAKKVFRETIQSVIEDPHQKLNSSDGESGVSVTEQVPEEASLMDVLLQSHESTKNQASLPKDQRHALFESFCRNTLLAKNAHVQEAVASLDSDEKRDYFRKEVCALFNLEIYTFFESWEGAPIHSISAKYGMASTCLSGGNTVLTFGYGGLVERLAYPLIQNNSISLNQNVISIETTTENKVVVRYQASGDEKGIIREIQAKACIIALPLGVLRAATSKSSDDTTKGIEFIPELPAPLIKSTQSLGIAVRNKIELLFPTRWWPESVGRITLACTHLQQTPTYHPYTTFIVESASSETDGNIPNILVCYVAGEFAKELEQKANEEIQKECMAVLRQADLTLDHQTTIPDPIAIHVTRWLSDPYSRGSWSFYGKGSNPDDVRAFRTNPDCQKRGLFFAGEHTCYGFVPGDDMGCVHGAWLSGEIAAKAALERIKSNS